MPTSDTVGASALTDYNKLLKLLSMQGIFKRITGLFFDVIESVVIALSIFVAIYYFLAQPHQVKGASMDTTFHDGEYILTDKISYRFSEPERGDVIVFKAPRNPDFDYIKRIIAVPGDTISIVKGKVYINGEMLVEDYISSDTLILPGQYLREGQQVTINEEEYFVLGDNRSHSSDSRQWGPVPENDVIGKVFFRYWPVSGFGKIKTSDGLKQSAYWLKSQVAQRLSLDLL